MKRTLIAIAVAFGLGGCAHLDRATIYTENGLELAEQEWDHAYRDRSAFCQSMHTPASPGMEECFGDWFDADAKVEDALRSAIAALRAYWLARAAGEKPDWAETARQVMEAFDALPPEAAEYFERVRGL